MLTEKPKFVLASSSKYRAKLLQQIGLSFEVCSPNLDESAVDNEPSEQLAARLSIQKARAVKAAYSDHIVIASDQVACLDAESHPIGKPHTTKNAIEQLTLCSGKTVTFYTGLSLIFPASYAAIHKIMPEQTLVETYKVTFRTLSEQQIQQYLHLETPLDCAGSFKAEGLGICLFNKFEGRDFNTLIGLPLMALVDTLFTAGIDVLQYNTKQ